MLGISYFREFACASNPAAALARCLAFLSLGAAGSAAIASDIPDNLSPTLNYAVTGMIEPRCELRTHTRSVSLLNVQDPSDNSLVGGQATLPFELSCNSPFLVSMTSKNGGLEYDALPSSDAAFTRLLAYRASVNFAGQGSVLACASEGMATGTNCSSRVRAPVSAREGAIEVTIAPRDTLLLAGEYRDEITIAVSPRIGGEE